MVITGGVYRKGFAPPHPRTLNPFPSTLYGISRPRGAVGFCSLAISNTVLSANYLFLGPQATVTTVTGQRLTGAATGAIGKSAAGSVLLAIGLCYQPTSLASSPANFVGGNYVVATLEGSSNRVMVDASASVVPGAGTYLVGLCASGNATLDSNDFVNGWVMVTNP